MRREPRWSVVARRCDQPGGANAAYPSPSWLAKLARPIDIVFVSWSWNVAFSVAMTPSSAGQSSNR
jgi:hypothetical protein